jgi:hypothetical protein
MWWTTLIDIGIVLTVAGLVTYVLYLGVQGWCRQPNSGTGNVNKWFYE